MLARRGQYDCTLVGNYVLFELFICLKVTCPVQRGSENPLALWVVGGEKKKVRPLETLGQFDVSPLSFEV